MLSIRWPVRSVALVFDVRSGAAKIGKKKKAVYSEHLYNNLRVSSLGLRRGAYGVRARGKPSAAGRGPSARKEILAVPSRLGWMFVLRQAFP